MEHLLAALRAVAEPTRLRLVVLCARGELTVSELTQILGQSQPRVSRHLKLLCEAGLLDRFREGSWVFYRLFHPEPVNMDADPFTVGVQNAAKDPFDANQAIPTLLFDRYRQRFEARFPDLKIVRFERFSFFAYPLSGGFRSWSLIPAHLVKPLLILERRLSLVLGPWMSFRLFVVLENSKLER